MSNLEGISKKKTRRINPPLQFHAKAMVSDYVTTVAWSPDGKTLAATSAAGEVILVEVGGMNQLSLHPLQTAINQSVDCLSFSFDSQFLAVGGQNGDVQIWRVTSGELIANLENARAWVDKIAWNPSCNLLAFSMGRYVQVWDADSNLVEVTLNFESSSVLDLTWHPVVKSLAISGYQGVKIWNGEDWDNDPHVLAVPSASCAIAWSPNGKFLACGNIDNTLIITEWGNPHPWAIRGFPGKVRQLAWSNQNTTVGAPLLAAASAEDISVWEKQVGENAGWDAWMLDVHEAVVNAIAFQSGTFLLASASEDGKICLWHQAEELIQILEGLEGCFSCLSWHPQGKFLTAGSSTGELITWSKSLRGQGFSRR